ncbi:MAG: AarF/ABC1/UbiB kinase family protein [Okeania sp. SIO3H1]|uniref:ABC1 kinase family protein n=1 Tax=Okeania sp. SIO1I7 TaxID=2607772 RepID=UPI0013CBC104|nr:AarF/UbiB family protein [Okeania sp. SIO1I7]NEN90001.1 AarF/ABC1/UbiB kinase family protein [Okeania sp. SIO3H1]NET29270.1 AarF/ABC1/UbiB kinase family protein [Okeania sp. SIO1I7]
MIKKKYIPTPIVEKKDRKKVKIVDKLEARRLSTTYIVWRFIVYLIGIQIRKFTGRSDVQKTATQLREIFEEFGGFWVKAGQLLALRSDLFPDEVCDELLKLQYQAIGFPFDIARSTIESELGKPIEKIFEFFDEQPLAAASIGQVHRAVLRKKKKLIPVVVKIQRPGLAESFKRDLDLIKVLVNVLMSLNIGSDLSLDEALAELEKTFREELDFRYEATSARRMKKTLKAHKIYTPKIYDKYSKRRVLVMEFIDGVLMADYIKTYQRDRAKARRWEDENDVDPKKVGESLYLSLLRQIYEDNLYHGDLHPGNIILLRKSKFVLIDLGSTGSLEKELRTSYLKYNKALSEGDFTRAADYLIRFAVDVPKVNISRARVEIAQATQTWADRSGLKGLSYKEKSLGGATAEFSQVLNRYGIPNNWSFLKVSRSLLTLDGSLQYLLPDFDYFKVSKKYNQQSERRALIQSLRPENIMASMNKLSETFAEYNDLVLPQLRQDTIPFELTVNRFALTLALILRALSSVLLIGGFGTSYVFLYQQYFGIIQPINFEMVDEFVRQLPYIPYLEWVGILIAGGLTFRILLACANILERKEFGK